MEKGYIHMVKEIELLTPKQFSHRIEMKAAEEGSNLLVAIKDYCEEKELDIESVASLINKDLSFKQRLKDTAIELNMVKGPKFEPIPSIFNLS